MQLRTISNLIGFRYSIVLCLGQVSCNFERSFCTNQANPITRRLRWPVSQKLMVMAQSSIVLDMFKLMSLFGLLS